MSSKKGSKKAPDTKGVQTLFAAYENAAKNVGTYKLQSSVVNPELQCSGHSMQMLQNAFEEFRAALAALVEHRVLAQHNATQFERAVEDRRRTQQEMTVPAALPKEPPGDGDPAALEARRQQKVEESRTRERALQSSLLQVGSDYLRVVRTLLVTGKVPPCLHLGHVFHLVVGKLERHAVPALAQEATTLLRDVALQFPPCTAHTHPDGLQYLALHPEAWDHLAQYSFSQAKEDAPVKGIRAEKSDMQLAVQAELEVKGGWRMECFGAMVEALHSATQLLYGRPTPESPSSDPSPLEYLALLLNLGTALDVMQQDLDTRIQVLEAAVRHAQASGSASKRDPPQDLVTQSLLWRTVAEAPVMLQSFERALKLLLRTLAMLGMAEARARGDEDEGEGEEEGGERTPPTSGQKADEESEEEIEIDDDVDIKVVPEGEDSDRMKTRKKRQEEEREAAKAAASRPKEPSRLESETSDLRAAFSLQDLQDLASRTLGLFLRLYSAAEAHGIYGGAGRTRHSGNPAVQKNLRVLLDKTIAEAISSKGQPSTAARTAIIRAVRDPGEIARVAANAIAWRMARRVSDERDFPSLYAVRVALENDGLGSDSLCADLEEALRYVEEDKDKLIHVFGVGGLRALVAHMALAVLPRLGEGARGSLAEAFATASEAALQRTLEDEKGHGALLRAGQELSVARVLVAQCQ